MRFQSLKFGIAGGEGLKKAAQNLAGVAPLVGEIAAKIVAKILALGA